MEGIIITDLVKILGIISAGLFVVGLIVIDLYSYKKDQKKVKEDQD